MIFVYYHVLRFQYVFIRLLFTQFVVRGLFQTKLQRGKIFLFRDRATSVKNLQNKFAITSLSVSTASLTRKAAPGSFVDFVGYSFLIADQNLLGEPTVSSKSSRWDVFLYQIIQCLSFLAGWKNSDWRRKMFAIYNIFCASQVISQQVKLASLQI